jgi:hypothetical protein
MFRQIMVDLAKVLNMFSWTAGMVLAYSKAVNVNMKAPLNRPWYSTSHERNFEQQMATGRALSELQSRLPIAR